MLYLSRFDFILKHVLGSSIEKTNDLSRHLDWQIKVERDNKDRVLVKKEWLEVRTVQVVEVVFKEVNLLKKIRKSEVKDDKAVKAVKEIKQAKVKMLRDKEQ